MFIRDQDEIEVTIRLRGDLRERFSAVMRDMIAIDFDTEWTVQDVMEALLFHALDTCSDEELRDQVLH
jgi:hypothetical protein